MLGYRPPSARGGPPRRAGRHRQRDPNFARAELRWAVKRDGPEVVVVTATEAAGLFPVSSSPHSRSVCTRPGKQDEEVRTHRTPANISGGSTDRVGPAIWERTRPEMVVSMVTPERVAWEMTPFGV